MSFTSLFQRACTLATVAVICLSGSSAAQAQSSFFNFNTKGSYFLTSVTQWSPSSAGHYAIGAQQPTVMGKSGYRTFKEPEVTVRGLTVSAVYVVKGIILGYEIFGGAGRAASDNTSGARMATSTVAGNVLANLGVMAFHSGGFSVMPVLGGGIGLYGVRFKVDGRAENLGAKDEEHDDIYVFNLAPIADAGLQMLFTVGHKNAVDANRFTMGLKGGYRQQFATGLYRANYDKLDAPNPTAVAGPYLMLNLGFGLAQ